MRPPPDLPLHVVAPASLHKGKWRVASIPADSKFLLDTKSLFYAEVQAVDVVVAAVDLVAVRQFEFQQVHSDARKPTLCSTHAVAYA